VTDEGVLFRSHLDGDQHLFTPQSTVDIQLALGSDIMMVLDECLAHPASYEATRESTARTIRWAQTAFDHYNEREKGLRCALFPIVQGGMYPDLRIACTEELLELNAPGYAIGGLSVGEPRELSQQMVSTVAPLLPGDRPRYVMGVGMPEELPLYVAQGIDMMDCVLPTRNARNGYLFTSQGKVMIKQAQYLDDQSRLDPACDCYTCRTFSRAYLRHLYQAGEILFSTLATLHNIRYYLEIMRNMRQAILTGTFPDFLRARAANSFSPVSGE
jgi:queuine tRNA-ribosyltransferase